MDLGMQLGQGLKQEQTLSPQLLQSVNILQKTSQELDVAISEELAANPLLEQVDGDSELSGGADDYEDNDFKDSDGPSELDPDAFERGSLEDSADMDSNLLDDYIGTSDYNRGLEDGYVDTDAPFRDLNTELKGSDEEWDRPIKDFEASLQDKLKNQLRDWNGTHELQEQLKESGCSEARFRSLVEYLVNSIDEKGFLQSDTMGLAKAMRPDDPLLAEIEAVLHDEIPLESASFAVREAFHVLHTFDPPGIGARNLRECFLIQAYRNPSIPPLSIKILEEHYEDMSALRYAKIAKDMGESSDAVQQAVKKLSALSPHPGLQISNTPARLITTDMRVIEKKGKFIVEIMRPTSQRHLRINRMYADLLEKGSVLSKEDRKYISEHMERAKNFIAAVDNRFSTMERVMQAIVARQQGFFKMGPAFLQPMILQEIADDVGRDPSTVNRVTNGKYVETAYGIFELKEFFTSGIRQGESPSDEVVGSARVLDAIKKLVDAEDKRKPLSDDAISKLLLEQNIKVARRTVAKYREEELKILPARLRKQL